MNEETGLYYYGARYYDPKTYVFLGVDPRADSVPGMTPYRYCFNNPINITDHSGEGEDGFISTWDESTQTYDKKKVNNFGGDKTNFIEYKGGPLDSQMQTVNNKTGK